MKITRTLAFVCLLAFAGGARASDNPAMDAAVDHIDHEWARIKYQVQDKDQKVRDTATKSLKALSGLKRKKPSSGSKGPAVFVNIDKTTDQSNRLPADASDRVMKIVKSNVERTGYSTTWPGGLPTSADLTSSRSRATSNFNPRLRAPRMPRRPKPTAISSHRPESATVRSDQQLSHPWN